MQNSGSFHSVPAAMIPSLAIVCNTCPCGLLFPWLTSGVFNLSLASCECRRAQGFLESAWAFMTFVCLLVPCLPHFLMQPLPCPGIDIYPFSRSLVSTRIRTGGWLFLKKLDYYNDVVLFEFIMPIICMSHVLPKHSAGIAWSMCLVSLKSLLNKPVHRERSGALLFQGPLQVSSRSGGG